MDNRSLIYKSVDMIEKNLRANISIEEVAKSIGFSYYYYNHLFKAITGISPSSYMNQRRIADAVRQLMTSEEKIIDIAYTYGYGSPEAFTRAFVRCFEQTPSHVRKNGLKNGELMLPPLIEGETFSSEHNPFIEPVIVETKEIQTVGLSFFYDFSKNKNDLSLQYNQLIDAIKSIDGIKQPLTFYQMQYWFEQQDESTMYIHIAVEVDHMVEIPFQLTYKEIPKGLYAKFYHKGLANQVSKTYDYIYKEWLAKTDYRLPYNYCFEHYGKDYLGPYNPNSISEIYIPLKRMEEH